MDSLRRKCFDCKHYNDAAVAGTLDGEVTESKFDFYHRFAAVAAAGHKSTAYRNIDSTDLIHVVDKSVHCVTCRNRSAESVPAAAVAFAVAVVVVGVAVGFVIYLALCEQ